LDYIGEDRRQHSSAVWASAWVETGGKERRERVRGLARGTSGILRGNAP
jgi:hypothetical protein